LKIVERVVEHFDEPFADSSAIPTWYVSEMARRHVTVVLSGDGGDELFGGYDRYLPHARVAQFDKLAVPGVKTAAGLTARALPRRAMGRRFLHHVALDDDERYVDAVTFYGARDRAALLAGDLRSRRARPTPEETFATRLADLGDLPAVSRQMRLDLGTYLPEDVLVKVDRMSMAHSIESRVPLLDHPLVELALSFPLSLKIRQGERKYLLRQVAARVLPRSVLTKRKQGFGVPIGLWFRGRLREAFGDVLQSARVRQRGYFEPREVQRVLDEHLSGKRDHELRLWQLLMFELWSRAYLDSSPRSVPHRPALMTTQTAGSGADATPDRRALP
jgi:asparagine synthase (glutamine-hydrolysing)